MYAKLKIEIKNITFNFKTKWANIDFRNKTDDSQHPIITMPNAVIREVGWFPSQWSVSLPEIINLVFCYFRVYNSIDKFLCIVFISVVWLFAILLGFVHVIQLGKR